MSDGEMPPAPGSTTSRASASGYRPYLGRKAEAIREVQRGVELVPVESDARSGAYYQHQLARIYILAGEPDRALDLLEPLPAGPYYLSPGWLRVDPAFDPLRSPTPRSRATAPSR